MKLLSVKRLNTYIINDNNKENMKNHKQIQFK